MTNPDPFCPPVPADFSLPAEALALKPMRAAVARGLLRIAEVRLDWLQERISSGFEAQRTIAELEKALDRAAHRIVNRRHQLSLHCE